MSRATQTLKEYNLKNIIVFPGPANLIWQHKKLFLQGFWDFWSLQWSAFIST